MAKISLDRDLVKQGYMGYRPEDIQAASSMRKKGYFDFVSKVALRNFDGLWYVSKKDRDYISKNFYMDGTEPVDAKSYEINNPPENIEENKALTAARHFNWRVLNFQDTDNPCKFVGCEALREAYKNDLTRLGENCAACETNKVKQKYTDIIKSLTEQEYGKF
jgi:hypothetical protein